MMSGDKKNIIYTSKDIEAYFTGQLSPLQRHAMEKDALDDPFLAEAIEGYEAMQGRSWKSQLVELHRHFEEERSPAKVIPLNRSTGRWWKVAAAVLVIGCGATLTYVLTNKKTAEPGKQEIAKVNTPVKETPTTVSPVTTPTKTENSTSVATKQNPAIKADPATTVVPNNPSLAQNTIPGAKGSVTVPEKKVVTDGDKGKDVVSALPKLTDKEKTVSPATKINTDDLAKSTITKSPANNTPVITAATNGLFSEIAATRADDAKRKAEQKQAPVTNSQTVTHNFLAQVVGPDNTPLPFANVTIKNEDFGTYADVRGNFKLLSTDSLINVEVRSVGYLPRVYTLRSSASQNRIVLAEDENTAKERAVVINNGAPSNRSARRGVMKDSLYVNVEPADGWDNYNAYVRNNIDIPENAVKKDLHGEVEVSFKVHPNGTVSDITVSQSDCADCAELAKRLVEQGPQWKIKKGIRKSSARIKVQF